MSARHRPAFLAALALTLASSAYASAAPPAAAAPGQHLDLSPMGLPVIWQGRLVNYIFVTVRLILAPGADAVALREKEPFFRDALVRAAHRHPFTRPDDFTKLDDNALRATAFAEAGRIVGPRLVRGVQIVSETPQRRTGLPNSPVARTASR